MNEAPQTVEVTEIEGGPWIPFDKFDGRAVNAIKFEDGRIWDVVNGWRPKCPA